MAQQCDRLLLLKKHDSPLIALISPKNQTHILLMAPIIAQFVTDMRFIAAD